MNKLLNAFLNMNDLDDKAMHETLIHQLHPLLKLISSLIMIVCILSSYHILELMIDFLFIILIAYMARISFFKLMKRGLIGLPLSFCLGISFLIFNQQTIVYHGFLIKEGYILCILVFMKTFLCLTVTYLLIATTSFDALVSELIYLKIPSLFVLQLTMTYRYIFTFLKEAKTMSQAYLLRSPQSKAIELKDMGSFIGHLLIRSMNESLHVYDCMKCRGFDVYKIYTHHQPFELENIFLLMIVFGVMLLIKVVF